MKVQETDEEKFYFSEYDAGTLAQIIKTQHDIVKHMKKQGQTKIYQILIVIDDFADDPSFCKHSKLLHQLYIRGRHNMISVITSTQKFNCVSTIIRTQMTELFIFRLRSAKDLESFLEEVSAIHDKKILMDIYNLATQEEFSFLYVKLNAKSKDHMFYIKFGKRIEIED
jgi:hypothetical protein